MDNEPLVYWKVNEKRLPSLSKLEVVYLNTPASSASVEDFFPLLGRYSGQKGVLLGTKLLKC